MANTQKKVPTSQLKKTTEKMKQKPNVKITGSASSTPRVSASMISARPQTTSLGRKPAVRVAESRTSVKTPMPKTTPKSPGRRQTIPPDYDVIIPGMGYTKPTKKNPPKKIKK